MPATLGWHNATKDIILVEYTNITVREHYQAVEDSKAMMDTVTCPRVDLITVINGGIRQLMNASQVGSNVLSHPNPRLGIIVIVYTNRLMLPLITIGIKFDARTRKFYRVASSIEEAEAIIAADRTQ